MPQKTQETAPKGCSAELQRESGGGAEQGSRRWRAEERFFGKSANPITGSGAALVLFGGTKITFQPALPLTTYLPLLPVIFFYFHSW